MVSLMKIEKGYTYSSHVWVLGKIKIEREGNEGGKGNKRSLKEAKGRALEKDATARQLLSPWVGSYDWCFGMGLG